MKSRLLGVLLNAVDSSAPDYYYSYRYYPYAYGYGYGEEAGKPPDHSGGSDETSKILSSGGILALSDNRRGWFYRFAFG